MKGHKASTSLLPTLINVKNWQALLKPSIDPRDKFFFFLFESTSVRSERLFSRSTCGIKAQQRPGRVRHGSPLALPFRVSPRTTEMCRWLRHPNRSITRGSFTQSIGIYQPTFISLMVEDSVSVPQSRTGMPKGDKQREARHYVGRTEAFHNFPDSASALCGMTTWSELFFDAGYRFDSRDSEESYAVHCSMYLGIWWFE